MSAALNLIANEATLMAHLDARFANALDERALGGFALLLLRAVGVADKAALDVCLQHTLRDTDFIARIDEAHYAIVIPQVSDVETAQRVADKLRAAVLPACANKLAIGGALFPKDAKSRDQLVDIATEKLVHASASGSAVI
jgi:predicted signal transduction protein with EAL and GGDEF domain